MPRSGLEGLCKRSRGHRRVQDANPAGRLQGGSYGPCDSSDMLPSVLMLLVGCGGVTSIYFSVGGDRASKDHTLLARTLTTARVLGVLQLVGVIARLSNQWPEPMSSLLRVLNTFSFALRSCICIVWRA
mmetsp:Transcript_30212/g.96273  ORF Transcript_30212/g.96273 Transcript_30212/m.96273 type:complete len:129 (+) Transcript_30212:90-476(+)